ncbi:MAG: peptidylprolyl isomerase, partial [Parcubacteria group bacterium]|nr:peptidylprolyl isomerase [Parcubacteria group bacterium]
MISLPLNPMRNIRNSHARRLAWILAALVAAVFLFGIGVYRFQWQSRAVYYAARAIPYPAIIVDWEFVPLHRYLSDLAALNSYWSFQRENKNVLLGIPDPQEIRERLVHKLITEQITAIWARKNRVTVSEQEVYLEWERLKEKPESEEEISKFLRTAYGWSDSQFIGRVLRPFLLQQKAKNALIEEFGKSNEDLEQEALGVYVLAAEVGADFSELAKQYSYDAVTGPRGGDLGYFGRGVLPPALEQAIFSMSIGEISAPVESSFGYHVIKLEDLLY